MSHTESDDSPAVSQTESDDSLFTTVSDSEFSKLDLYKHKLDQQIYTPLSIIWDDWRARTGVIIIIGYILMGTIGVALVPPPRAAEAPKYILPFQTLKYPLGTNGFGTDLFAQTIHATPAMLKMITSGALFATGVATVVGTWSGYKGGLTDRVLMTVTDIMMTVPGLPLVIVISVILEPRSPFIVGIILTINAWAGLARAIRSQVLTIREEPYIEASRALGMETPYIVREDILPNLMPYILINFMRSANQVIFASVGLYFLGILPFTTLNWGVMMNMAYTAGGALYTWKTLHWFLIPILTIIILSLGLILFSQGTDRLFNPRVRARHAKTIADDDTQPTQ